MFFFKQRTASEMRFSDWSSDVCSSDLHAGGWRPPATGPALHRYLRKLFIMAAVRVRAQSGALYERAAHDYQRFFADRMPSRHEVFESEWLNPNSASRPGVTRPAAP